MRYLHDFGLSRRASSDRYLGQYWSTLDLDLAYVDWSPLRSVEIRGGRQWNYSALGMRDFDGLSVNWSPELADGVHAHVGAYGGLDVETGYGRLAPDTWDVQGVPPRDGIDPAATEGTKMIAGGRLGMSVEQLSRWTFSYRRRWREGAINPYDDSAIVGSERLGLASSTVLGTRVTLSAHGVYNTILSVVDSAGVSSSWRIPGLAGTLSAGFDHEIPWFDSSSIFNVFGAKPHRGGFAVYQHGVAALRTQFEARGWARHYIGDPTSTTADTADERALGAALAHSTRLRVWNHPVRWNSQATMQQSVDRDTQQYLADTRLRLPIGWEEIFVSGRAVFLAAVPQRFSEAPGYASSMILGLDIPLNDAASISVALESTASTFAPGNTSFYTTLLVDHWP